VTTTGTTGVTGEPERDLARRLVPLAGPATAAAFLAGSAIGGPGAGASAAIGVVAVAANLAAHAASLGWASGVSASAVLLVGVGGYALRIATFALGLLLLDRLAWFSAVAFVAGFVPATLALLAIELRLLAGRRTQADLWYFRERA
jgi:hypothetical protein